jgi:hypothetical protein
VVWFARRGGTVSMKMIRMALAAGALALWAGTALGSPVYTYTGKGVGATVNITSWPAPKPSGVGTSVFAGSFKMEEVGDPLNKFVAWCLDLAAVIKLNDTFKETGTPFGAPDDLLTDVQKGRVQGIFDAHLDDALASGATGAAGLQLALWEAISDDTFNLTAGNFAVSAGAAVIAKANSYLSFTLGSAKDYVVSYLQNERTGPPRGQNLVTASPVPLPAAAWLLVGGIGALVATRRRRRATAT